eukprot:6196632-Pleurochrysis_carterae.AAC.2
MLDFVNNWIHFVRRAGLAPVRAHSRAQLFAPNPMLRRRTCYEQRTHSPVSFFWPHKSAHALVCNYDGYARTRMRRHTRTQTHTWHSATVASEDTARAKEATGRVRRSVRQTNHVQKRSGKFTSASREKRKIPGKRRSAPEDRSTSAAAWPSAARLALSACDVCASACQVLVGAADASLLSSCEQESLHLRSLDCNFIP